MAEIQTTEWFSRDEPPVRPGFYECHVRYAGMPGQRFWEMLEWDGQGFLVPFPLVVLQWRGVTKQTHDYALSNNLDLVAQAKALKKEAA